LLAEVELATRLDATGTRINDTTIYGLDYVPPDQRDRLDYQFEPPETDSAILVGDSTENIHTGVTLETSSEKIHSVRTAVLSAVSDGEIMVNKVVVHSDGKKELCGICRQLIYDFSDGEAEIRVSSSIGETEHYDIEELLP
jgi:hypothetical protein